MLNPNKFFPRLTISAKLAIAFAILAAAPALVVAGLATRTTVASLREASSTTLDRDMQLAYERVSVAIEEVRQHLSFFSATVGEPVLEGGSEGNRGDWLRLGEQYLAVDSSAVLRFKVLDSEGFLRFSVDQEAAQPPIAALEPLESSPEQEFYYVNLAYNQPGNPPFVEPIELRSIGPDGQHGVLPAVAAVQPIEDADGELIGVVVAEALASVLFEGLESASPGLVGVTGLVRPDGLFLFHSERKSDWLSLLEPRPTATLVEDFGSEASSRILSGGAGQLVTADDLIDYRSLPPQSEAAPSLILYRAVPTNAVTGPVWGFLRRAGIFGLAILGFVIGVSSLAARQFTRPIYRLQRAVRHLSADNVAVPIVVETNDELEDLANDFNAMANTVVQARKELQATVEVREDQLKATQAELADIITHAADAIISLGPEGRVRLWNSGAEALFGYASGEVLGKPLEDLIMGPDVPPLEERSFVSETLTQTGSVVNLQTSRRTRDGEVVPVSLTQTLVESDGQIVGSSLIFRDERTHRRLEEHMRRSERVAAISVMAAGLAHELNNPIAIMGNRIELMQRDAQEPNSGPGMSGDLGVLKGLVDRMGGITGDLLSFARDDDAERASLDLAEVVDRVVRLLERSFRKGKVTLKVAVEEELPAVFGNVAAVETVVVNLLMNALQAVEPGGCVELQAAQRESTIVIVVGDDGPGVPYEMKSQIFEPFYTTKERGEGTGLGLTVVRTIVERHGGSIHVDSGGSAGARFVVTLPTAETSN